MNTANNPATIQYIGEHLLPGQFGYFFTLLSLVASLVASFAFAKAFFSNNIEEENSWSRLAKIAFSIEAITVLASFIILTYVISVPQI